MKLTTFNQMNWQQFINRLKIEFRLSDHDFETLYGISAVTIWNISNGKTKKPTHNTIKKLEEALNIKIDDSDPQNITYTKQTLSVNEPKELYKHESITEDDFLMLEELKRLGIDSIDKLKKFYNPEMLAEDIKEFIKQKLLNKK